MYLAGILGLCALLHAPLRDVSSGRAFVEDTRSAVISNTAGHLQEPTKPAESSTPPAQESQTGKPPAPEPSATSPAQTPKKSSAPKSSAATKPSAPKKHKPAPKLATDPNQNPEPRKTVIRKGGTLEPTTQLTPGGTDEQAARQRKTTKDLLASTDTALQRLNGRLLTADEQDTVAQIRVYVNQSNAADKAGDLERAYKLALKAHLLSDALVQQ